jgi:hypothetical protein
MGAEVIREITLFGRKKEYFPQENYDKERI